MEFTGQAAQYGLEETVNGLHTETAVVLKYHVKRNQGFVAYGLLIKCDSFFYLIIVTCGAGQVMADAVELRQYALFHLGRGFVGKSYRKDMTVVLRLTYEHGDILYGQTERFA